MREYIELGPAPAYEDCVQVGEPDYAARAFAECSRYIEAIRAKLGSEPEGASLRVKSFRHDFGRYFEVVCWFDPEIPAGDTRVRRVRVPLRG